MLGLAASHNGAAALFRGPELVVAVQEERLTRDKRAALAPAGSFQALDYVLDAAGIGPGDLELVVVCPLRTRAAEDCQLARSERLGGRPRAFVGHHRAHALSAVLGSGFDEAAVLVVDGMGAELDDLDDAERAAVIGPREGRETASIYAWAGGRLRPVEKQLGRILPDDPPRGRPRPLLEPYASLGTMFQSVARHVFGGWFDAGKVMGLAPYGTARLPVEAWLGVDGPRLVFEGAARRAMWLREPWPAHREAYADLAASVQAACTAGILHLARRARELTGCRRLALAGGVALNGIANEAVIQAGLFDEVFVIPAAEDSGTALGAGVHGVLALGGPARLGPLPGDALGRAYGEAEIAAAVGALPADAGVVARREEDVAAAVAALLERGLAVGWHQGRSELGPRALGQRSILFDPRRPDGQAHLNARVKHREAFRPFAPAVLADHAAAWLDFGAGPAESPYMLRVVPVRPDKRALVPAVTHVDGSARPQTVPADGSPLARVLAAFYARTGVPMLLNTSFNVAGEPLVETPADALRCLLATGLDACAVGDWLVVKDGAN